MRRLVLLALVLVGIVAFAAEPSTSTEADIHDGRAHGAFLHASSADARLAQAATPGGDLRVPQTPTAIATLFALLLAAAATAVVVPRVAGGRSMLRWATTAHRGPPARA